MYILHILHVTIERRAIILAIDDPVQNCICIDNHVNNDIILYNPPYWSFVETN